LSKTLDNTSKTSLACHRHLILHFNDVINGLLWLAEASRMHLTRVESSCLHFLAAQLTRVLNDKCNLVTQFSRYV